MSGNPFRAPLHQNQPAAAPVPPASFVHADSSSRAEGRDQEPASVHDAPALPAKTKKSVRIESPTTLDDAGSALAAHTAHGQHAGSPPPMSPAGFSDDFEDVVADAGGGARDAAEGSQRAGGGASVSASASASASAPDAPANPFSRTLASLEPQGEMAGAGPSRSLDVEGFKNMLMAGIAGPFENNSSTDASSASRQSIFEPVQQPRPESPITSLDMAASDDEAAAALVADAHRERERERERARAREKKKPPPAPKHRHGKLVSSRQPQTVSFSDFSVTEPTPNPVSRSRPDSDLNKPLPPTPPAIPSSPASMSAQNSIHDQPAVPPGEAPDHGDAQVAQKKVPPPVPLARRQSQLRSSNTGNRSRSNSSLTMSSQHSMESSPLTPNPPAEASSAPSMQKSPPPPPPTRRHGASMQTSSANSSGTEVPSTARRPTVSSNPPTSRRTTLSSESSSPPPSLRRTSSINSARNQPRSVSNESVMPPPPPPPRRRQSGRQSHDKEQPTAIPSFSPPESSSVSLENKRSSLDSKKRTSVTSESLLKHEYNPMSEHELPTSEEQDGQTQVNAELHHVPQDHANNILDDMDKFQREIEELRAKYKQAE